MKRISAIHKAALWAAVLCAACGPSAFAQTGYVTVSASHLTDSTGTAITNATVAFAPTSNAGTPIGYRVNGAGQAITSPVTAAVTSGAFTITLADTNLTAPQNVCFSVTVTDNTSGNILLGGSGSGYSCVQPAYSTTSPNAWCSAGVCNFDNYYPPATPGVVQTTGPTGPTGPGGAPCSSSTTPCLANGINTDLYVNTTSSPEYPTVQSAVTAACAASPIARVMLPSGTQAIGGPVSIPTGCTLELDGPSEGLATIQESSGFTGTCTDGSVSALCVQAGASLALRHATVEGLGHSAYGVEMQLNAGNFTLDHANVQDTTVSPVNILDATSINWDHFYIGNRSSYCTARPCSAVNWYLQNESPSNIDIQNGTIDTSQEAATNFIAIGIFPLGTPGLAAQTTATVTQGTNTITVASATGIANNQWATGVGIPSGPITVSGTTVTLPSNATVSGTLVPVFFYTPKAYGTTTISATNLSTITVSSVSGTPTAGMSLEGAGVNPGVIVTSVSGGSGTYTIGLSLPTTATTSASPISFWHPLVQNMTFRNVKTLCPLNGTAESDCNVFGESSPSPQPVQFINLSMSGNKTTGVGQFVNWGSGAHYGFVLGNQIAGALNFTESNNIVQNTSQAWFLETFPPTGKATLSGGVIDDAGSQSTTDGVGHYAQWTGIQLSSTATSIGSAGFNAPQNVKIVGKNMQMFPNSGGQSQAISVGAGTSLETNGNTFDNFSIGIYDLSCGGNKFGLDTWTYSGSGTGIGYENLATSTTCPGGVNGNLFEHEKFNATGATTGYGFAFIGATLPSASGNIVRWTTRLGLNAGDKLPPGSGFQVLDDNTGNITVNNAAVTLQGGNLATSAAMVSNNTTNLNVASNNLADSFWWQLAAGGTVSACTTSTCTASGAPTVAPPDGGTYWELATTAASWIKNFGGSSGGTQLQAGQTYCTTFWLWSPSTTWTYTTPSYYYGTGTSWVPISATYVPSANTSQTTFIQPQSGTTIYIGNNVQTSIGACGAGLVTLGTTPCHTTNVCQVTTPTEVNAIAGASGYSPIQTGSSGTGTITYTSSQTASIADNGKLVVMNCNSCSYTLPNPQPGGTFKATVLFEGTTPSIVLGSSMTWNGTTAPTPLQWSPLDVRADSATATNYLGSPPPVAGSNLTITPSATGLTYAATGGGSTTPKAWGWYSPGSGAGTGQITTEITPTTTSGTVSVTITRFQLEVVTAAVGCSTFPVISIYDLTASAIVTSITLSTGHNYDSGALSIATTAGHVLYAEVSTAGAGCSTQAVGFSGVVQYQ